MFRAVNPFCIALGLVGAFVQIHRMHSAKSGPLVINKGLWVMIGGLGRFCSCGNVTVVPRGDGREAVHVWGQGM